MGYLWLLGVGLAAFASFVSNLGVTLQKLQHIRIEEERRSKGLSPLTSNGASNGGPNGNSGGGSEDTAAYHKGTLWKVGLGLVIFGSLADFSALSFASQSLIAPLGSLTLVSNVIYAPCILKESVTR